MTGRRSWISVAMLAIALAGLALTFGTIWSAAHQSVQTGDAVAANTLVGGIAAQWDHIDTAGVTGTGPDFTVVDLQGKIRLHRGDPIINQLDAVHRHASALQVVVDGAPVGQVFIGSNDATGLRAWQHDLLAIAGPALGGAATAVLAWWFWTQLRIVGPFTRLQGFATQVAGGNLDTPLRMDRGNLFGAFTESFDILRTELAAAKNKELSERESKQTLVAQLSHDIRTPLASIEATTELLALRSTDDQTRGKLDIVLAKTHQIEHLVADLFNANADQLDALPIAAVDLASVDIPGMIASADVAGLVASCSLPDCLIRADPLRLQQVIDNILTNSTKYAGTPIEASGTVGPEFLTVRIRDRGDGLPDDELTAVLGKGVRGSNTEGVPGSGLGLYTSNWLMHAMGGDLVLENARPGLAVSLALPLSGFDAQS